MKVTGHRSVQSLDDCNETDEEEQQRVSSAIAKRNYENPSAAKKQMAVSEGHHKPCGSTLSERVCATHIGGRLEESDERKPIPAITFMMFSSSEFLLESNHDGVPGTDHDELVELS